MTDTPPSAEVCDGTQEPRVRTACRDLATAVAEFDQAVDGTAGDAEHEAAVEMRAAATALIEAIHRTGQSDAEPDALAMLFNAADDDEAATIDQVARNSGLLWRCSCGWNNPGAVAACSECGAHFTDL